MKLFISGTSGFAGSYLQEYLSNDSLEIYAPSLRESLDINALHECNAFVHLAGKAHDLKKVSDPSEYYKVNFELTKELYDAFLKSEARKFIFISSVKAAADTITGSLKEDFKPNPQTHYGKSKLMAEEYIQNQPLPEGKSYYILRPCMIHGPGNKGNLNLLYQFVKTGLPYPLAAFENKRSFLSIENLCFIIKELLEQNDVQSGIYNVADDEAISTTQIVTLLAEGLNMNARFLKVPPGVITTAAALGNVLRLPLNSERLEKLTESYVVSNAKVKSALRKELPVSARQGILITAKSL
ncbi:MAG TPA: NAD-dependent epimerase/dehydratase family protein [Daejeonella sp.]|nr:NAD-dependent epimerase/dehydratase family protein [Daejeonella sp.]